MIDTTDLTLDSALETQLKFKILHSYEKLCYKNHGVLVIDRYNLLKIFFKVMHTISLKKVLSGKVTNRIVINYFKKFLSYSIGEHREKKKCFGVRIFVHSSYQ
uniref:Uncharacterized protein n=1 Tax=Cryptomonas curvata TaxID=233186 RepID=A0A222AH72_9CRYP|nr:hypothetical protein [Cryptomonas curvata]ASO75715.1 hypothetical protein [Cryptomonas curvata]